MFDIASYSVTISGKPITLLSLATGIVVLVGGFYLARQLTKRAEKRLGQGPNEPRWKSTSARILGVLLRVFAIAAALQVTGIDVSTLFAASAVLAVGVGIALQKVAENFVSGLILFVERTVREGDIIEITGIMARVREIGVRSTIVQTIDDYEIIVPNSLLVQAPVTNYTLHERFARLRVSVGVSYASDLNVVRAVLEKVARELPWRSSEKDPVILLVEFGTSSIDYNISVWTEDAWGIALGRSKLREAIWQALREAKIEIPFPQLDLHVDRDLREAVTRAYTLPVASA
ncbi:MAG: mechanosensitive ion channel [Deltaproteobacteria bacterium]|nr:mechanosensitive ion channel [Deltaproteobacteria bacterium]